MAKRSYEECVAIAARVLAAACERIDRESGEQLAS